MSFLRYFDGAKPGKPVKRTNTEEDVRVKKTKYDRTKRERKFQWHWLRQFTWLEYDDDEDLMLCQCCKEYDLEKKTVFTTGSNKFKIDALKQHEQSKLHIHYMNRFKVDGQSTTATNTNSPAMSKASECLFKLKKADYDNLVYKFRNAHAIAKSHKSFKDFTFLNKLDRIKGIDSGKSYDNDKACAIFIHAIADVTRQQMKDLLHTANFFSFTIDGCTDMYGDDLENVQIRMCLNGKVHDAFINIGNAESSSSRHIFDYINEMFENLGLSEIYNNKLVGFCADGASNMQGQRTGLAALLIQRFPHIIVTHCLAHRLELSFKDAVKKNSQKIYDRCMTLLLGIFYLYHKSPKWKKALIRCFDTLNMKKNLPTRVGGTRWLPHLQRAINAFIKGYRAIRMQLESASHENAKCEGLAKLARDGHVLVFILQLKGVVSKLMKLSLYLQKTGLSLSDCHTRLMATKTVITQMLNVDDPSIVEILNDKKFQEEAITFIGRTPTACNNKLIQNILQTLDNRFPAKPIVDATMISNFCNWPKINSEHITDYGCEEVRLIATHFADVLTRSQVILDELLEEWTLLKAIVYEKFSLKLENGTLGLEEVHHSLQNDGLDNVLLLMDLLRSLPPTSVRNETTFSAMKLTKGKRRGHLNSKTLNDLLLVHHQSDSIESFDPDLAIKLWMKTPSGRKRRLNYQRVDAAKSTPSVESTPSVPVSGDDFQSEVIDNDNPIPGPSQSVQVQGLFHEQVIEENYDIDCPWDSESGSDAGYSSGDSDDNEMSSAVVDRLLTYVADDNC